MLRLLKKTLIVLLIVLAVVVAAALTVYWPVLRFARGWGPPVLYRVADLPSTRESGSIAIIGGTLVDGNGGPPLDDSLILIQGERIADVGRRSDITVPPDAVKIQAAGKTVLPGLIDMHVHLSKGDDLQLFLAAGVTTVRDVGNFTAWVARLAAGTRSKEFLGPRIFFSGESFVHESGFAAWQQPTKDVEEARAKVRERIAHGASVIKIVADITPELAQAIVEEAHRASVPVTADILGNNMVTAECAIGLGVDGLEHVSGVPQSIRRNGSPADTSEPVGYNAMFGWLYPDQQKEQALIASIVEHGTYVVPTFVVLENQAGVPIPPDPATKYLSRRAATLWTAMSRLPDFGSNTTEMAFFAQFAYSQPFVRKLAAAGGRIVAGTDTPTPGLVPGFSLHRELELLVQAGLTPMQAIEASTKTAAQFLGRKDQIGTVAAGKLADVIIVDGALEQNIVDIRKVRTVLQGGAVYDAAELSRLSEKKD
jgi:imidazolonepropionase-like amidohydrolase